MRQKKLVNAETLNTYTAKERNMYLIGLAGQNIIYNIVGTALQYYFESVIFIPTAIVATIMAIARGWDAINDPMMGTIVDKTRTKWGKCRPYLLFVPLPILIVTILCFTNVGFYTDPAVSKSVVVIWAAVFYILWGMTYTIGDIPLWGITALMTEKSEDRNSLLSLARIAGGVGSAIVVVAIQPVSIAIGQYLTNNRGFTYNMGQRYGFLLGAAIFAFLGCALFQLAGIFVRERIRVSEKKNTMGQNFKLMWTNKPFRQILLSSVLRSPQTIVMIVAFTLVTYYYANQDPGAYIKYLVILGAGLFVGQFGAIAVVPKLVKKHEKKKIYNLANAISAVPFLMIFVVYQLAPNHDVTTPLYLVLYAIFFTFGGAAIGATTVLQSLMIADCVDYEEHKSGLRPDGVFFSGQSFATKLAAGIASIISGIGYSIVNFSDVNREAVNNYIANGGIARLNPDYEPYMMIMFFLISIPPAVGSLLAVIPTLKYALTDREHRQILEQLNERRHMEAGDKTDA